MNEAESANAENIARVLAALAEGFCPAGHELSKGGGTCGGCDTCATTWTAGVECYSYRTGGCTGGFWLVTGFGTSWVYEFAPELSGIERP